MSAQQPANPHDVRAMPYKIAVLCYLYDEEGRLLLLHRRKPPNRDMYSPIGGKLEITLGEGPHDCALREIREEASVELRHDEIRLISIVSETAYQGEDHWLIFLFEVTRPIQLKSAALNCTPLDFSASSMASVCETVPSAVPSLGAMR